MSGSDTYFEFLKKSKGRSGQLVGGGAAMQDRVAVRPLLRGIIWAETRKERRSEPVAVQRRDVLGKRQVRRF